MHREFNIKSKFRQLWEYCSWFFYNNYIRAVCLLISFSTLNQPLQVWIGALFLDHILLIRVEIQIWWGSIDLLIRSLILRILLLIFVYIQRHWESFEVIVLQKELVVRFLLQVLLSTAIKSIPLHFYFLISDSLLFLF